MDVLAQSSDGIWGQWLWPLLQFIIGLGLVVFVHELGHFLAAKWAGVRVEEFAFGFPPRLFGVRWGETEYRVNAIPLGGYVKMTGQDDLDPAAAAPEDPRSWQRARYSRRLAILSAGVAMNVLFAALVFVVVYLIGIRFTAPIIGGVAAGKPAARAEVPPDVAERMPPGEDLGLRPGDRVEAINGKPVRRWEQVAEAGILSRASEVFRLTIRREIDGRSVTFETTLKPEAQDDPEFGRFYAFGVTPAASNIIDTPGPIGYAGPGQLQKEDRIVAIAGKAVDNSWGIPAVLQELPLDGPTKLTVLRGGQRVDVPVEATVLSPSLAGQDLLNLAGLLPRMTVANVRAKSPAAKAGLQPGDVIVEYGGVKDPSRRQLGEISNENVDQDTPLKLRRDGEVVETVVRPEAVNDKALIGFEPLPELAAPFVAEVAPDSPAAEAGVEAGGVITAVNDRPVSTWANVYFAFKAADRQDITLTWTKDGQEHLARLGRLSEEQFDPSACEVILPALLTSDRYLAQTDLVRGHPGQAIVWAVQDTLRFLRNVYATLRLMATGRVGLKGVQGPAGIGQFAVLIARESSLKLVYFMAMLSVMIAAFNFLPLPVLDGGHVVLVTIEKLRGRPLPLKVVATIQKLGFAALLCLFLLITWQDIVRMVGW